MYIGKTLFAQDLWTSCRGKPCVASWIATAAIAGYGPSVVRSSFAAVKLQTLLDLRVVQVALAGGVVLQVDQAASENQAFLRYLGERRQNANLDRHQRLRAGGDRQEATQAGRVLSIRCYRSCR